MRQFPSRSVNYVQDRIVIRSDFCSGNLSKAVRGQQRNQFDLWIASDSEPHFQDRDEFHRTWFYFSISGVPQGEQVTFTFRNLHNQVRTLKK